MNHFKRIALSIFLTTCVFCAVLYSSCQKDSCKGVTCLNEGVCSGGACYCTKAGTGGVDCEIIYRNLYADTCVGIVTMTGNYDSTHSVTDSILPGQTIEFVIGNDSTYDVMTLNWSDSTSMTGIGIGKLRLSMPIVLSDSSSNGSVFTVAPVVNDTFTYSGKGTVNKVSATLNLTRTHPNGTSKMFISFNNFSRR